MMSQPRDPLTQPREIGPDAARDNAASAEEPIAEMASRGELSRSAQSDIRRQAESGLSVTFLRGTQVVKRSPDGRFEVLGEIEVPEFHLPSDVRVIRP